MLGTLNINSRKRRALLAAALVVAASGLVVGSQASASHPEASLAGSNFEIDVDANLKLDDAAPSIDWASVPQGTTAGTEIRGIDKTTGQTDDSYVGGTKEDTSCPGETTGSIPNNKSDLLTLQAYQEAASAGNSGFFNFAWSRVSDPSGTTLMDFEFNQGTTPCVGSPNIQRTIGDRLVEYSIDQGGARANLTIRSWTGSAWGPATVLTSGTACGGGACAAGTINTSTIPANETDGLSTVAKQPRTFGEAQIDLRLFGGGGANPCVNFGFLTVKSRSSDSFTSQLKDFIKPVPIALGNCAKVIVRKVTDPAGSTQSFNYTSTAVTSPVTSGAFSLTGAAPNNVKTIDNVIPGNGYTITEDALPTGWDFVSLDCSASTGVNVTVDSALRKGTYSIDAATDIVDCTYTNRQRGTITVDKVTDPTGSTQSFDFTSNYGAPFSLTDASTPNSSGLLVPGTYNVAETPVTGWTLTSATCSDGSPVTAIALGAGENITCTFNNQARGNILVIKETDPDGSPQAFEFDTNYGDNFFLHDGDPANDSGPLAPGTYSVDELTPAGWEESGVVCTGAGGASEVATAINLAPGETVTCVFSNEQDAHIIVVKQVVGPNPNNQLFPFTASYSATGFSLQNGQSNDSGALDPGTYAATETLLPNWKLVNADPGGSNTVACTGGENSGAISLQAGEIVTCTFVNEWQVGAIRISKTAKHADSESGSIAQAGVDFLVEDTHGGSFTVTTLADGTFCVDSLAFDDYTITEQVPSGYAGQDPVTVTVDTVSYCNNPYGGSQIVPANFVNTPLTNVTVSVDSQVDGGTASVVACVDTNGDPVALDNGGATGANGDGSFSVLDLEPTDPAVTLTCTITIDP